jgi:MraZ protein
MERMGSLTGEYNSTLDDKGRLSLPSRLRAVLSAGNSGSVQVLTKGMDKCLSLYPPDEWNLFKQRIIDSTNVFKSDSRNLRRRLIGPAQELEIDKAGRIAIPQTLREYAELNRDCVILGQDEYVEIWDAENYRNYTRESEDEYQAASERLGNLLQEREQKLLQGNLLVSEQVKRDKEG